ncbi:MAG: DNA polymerase-3 subunit delta [Phycisphaerales bacterium]|jgi:DNA polymerase-3 subunit delta
MAKKASTTTDSPPTADDRVVVLHGKELFLRDQATSQLREALQQVHGEVEVVRFVGNTTSAADVLDECRSFGLMAPYKLVVVDDAEQLVIADTRPLFERYAQAPSENATLVLRADTWRPGNLDKMIANVGRVIKLEPMGEGEAVSWVGMRARDVHGAKIEREAAGLLVHQLGTDLSRLDAELAKLATLAIETEQPITRQAVVELVGGTKEEVAWSVQSQLLSGSAEHAITQIRAVQAGNKGDMSVPLTWACVDLARKVSVAAAGLAGRENPQALSKALRLWGPAQDAVFSAARHLGPARARALYQTCLDADAAGKSGLGKADRTLERLAVEYQIALRGS